MSRKYSPKVFSYRLGGFAAMAMPRMFYSSGGARLERLFRESADQEYILERVDYYNRISSPFSLPEDAVTLREMARGRRHSIYRIDLWKGTRNFDPSLRISYEFGDVNWIEKVPVITKSRPICDGNSNNVILKLDRCRHFNFISDPIAFRDKSDMGVFRADIGDAQKQNRAEFMHKWFGSGICDCGSIRNMPGLPDEWIRPRMSIEEQLKYKYILSLEGNDVATSLKWIMSSNSIAVMPKPTCETWFMEGTLLPGVHYIEIRPDFSDLDEKLEYYSSHPEECLHIIDNAHKYVSCFAGDNDIREQIIEYLVLKKYFELSGQI